MFKVANSRTLKMTQISEGKASPSVPILLKVSKIAYGNLNAVVCECEGIEVMKRDPHGGPALLQVDFQFLFLQFS